jgi:uncharacterized radical SAM superfamily Fe-S cluster-containing enzyme
MEQLLQLSERESLLKRTTSRCPICFQPCPAEVWKTRSNRVFLTRTCALHGEASVCIASDARFYWLARGNSQNSECCEGRGVACCSSDNRVAGSLGQNAQLSGEATFDKLSTCLALIEIVRSCNLKCPTCYADSPLSDKVDAVPLADIQNRVQGIIDRKGRIEILQLSGGEPTLHPEFFKLLQWAGDNPGIDYLLLNTNGVLLARDERFAMQLGQLFSRGGLQIYLQFDGRQLDGQQQLRGADLRTVRVRAIEHCRKAGLPVTLAMTVTEETLPSVWDAIEFGLCESHIHGITFQPFFGSGRAPLSNGKAARLNTADILLAAIEQSRGCLRAEDFTPLPCGDPNCAVIGYLLRIGGQVQSISNFVDFRQLHGFLKDKVHYTVADLARCGCENEPLGELLKNLELKGSSAFRIMIKPFMDAWSWDQDRIDRCCTHVIRPDGKLDSFCRYYSGFPDTRATA